MTPCDACLPAPSKVVEVEVTPIGWACASCGWVLVPAEPVALWRLKLADRLDRLRFWLYRWMGC